MTREEESVGEQEENGLAEGQLDDQQFHEQDPLPDR